MDDIAPFAFGGRVVRFSRIGKPRQYRVFLAGAAGTDPASPKTSIWPRTESLARIRKAVFFFFTRSWDLSARLTASDERELAFEVGMVG